jgi:transposase-like protein
MKGKAYPDETKAKIIAALLAGATVSEISQDFDIPQQSISNYKKTIPPDALSELGRKRGERLDDLVYQVLIRNLRTLNKQAEIASEADYIRKQPADQLATLYGVMADKTIRLLAATTGGGPKQLEAGNA